MGAPGFLKAEALIIQQQLMKCYKPARLLVAFCSHQQQNPPTGSRNVDLILRFSFNPGVRVSS